MTSWTIPDTYSRSKDELASTPQHMLYFLMNNSFWTILSYSWDTVVVPALTYVYKTLGSLSFAIPSIYQSRALLVIVCKSYAFVSATLGSVSPAQHISIDCGTQLFPLSCITTPWALCSPQLSRGMVTVEKHTIDMVIDTVKEMMRVSTLDTLANVSGQDWAPKPPDSPVHTLRSAKWQVRLLPIRSKHCSRSVKCQDVGSLAPSLCLQSLLQWPRCLQEAREELSKRKEAPFKCANKGKGTLPAKKGSRPKHFRVHSWLSGGGWPKCWAFSWSEGEQRTRRFRHKSGWPSDFKRHTNHWSALAYCTGPIMAYGHWRWQWNVSRAMSHTLGQLTPTPSLQRRVTRASHAPTPRCHYAHTYFCYHTQSWSRL